MELTKIDTKIAKAFKINILEVQDMVKEYQKMTLIEDDEASYKICRHALTSCIRTRTGIDKRRKELNSKAQNEIKGRNTAAKQLAAIIAPAEDHLTSLVKGEDARVQAIEAEEQERQQKLIQERVDELIKVDCVMPFMDIATLSEDEFENLYQKKEQEWAAKQVKKAEEEAILKAENERLEKQKKEQEAEAEALRIKKVCLEAQEKAVRIEKDRIAKVNADLKAAEEAKIQAEKDAKEKVETEAKEKVEKEKAEAKEKKRQRALMPDKEKLKAWVVFFDLEENNPYPKLKDKKATILFERIVKEIEIVLQSAFEQIEAL